MIHDTHVSQFISPFAFAHSGTAVMTATIASNVVSNVRGASTTAHKTYIPIPVLSNQSLLKGAYLTSVDVFYTIAGEVADDFATVEFEKLVLPVPAAATGTAFTATAPASTCDAFHNTAALRLAIGNHTMTVTLTTPFWVDDNDALYLQLVVDMGASGVYAELGARANYTLRL